MEHGDKGERGWLEMLTRFSDDDLSCAVADYIWLAEFGPSGHRHTFERRRDAVVTECERRGRADLVRAARAKIVEIDDDGS